MTDLSRGRSAHLTPTGRKPHGLPVAVALHCIVTITRPPAGSVGTTTPAVPVSAEFVSAAGQEAPPIAVQVGAASPACVQSSEASGASRSTAPLAALGPAFSTANVKLTSPPVGTEVGSAVLTIDRSADRALLKVHVRSSAAASVTSKLVPLPEIVCPPARAFVQR